jgi:hypothetical protein
MTYENCASVGLGSFQMLEQNVRSLFRLMIERIRNCL